MKSYVVVVGKSVVVVFQGTESPLTHPNENKILKENVQCIAKKNVHLLQYRGDVISGNLITQVTQMCDGIAIALGRNKRIFDICEQRKAHS